MLEVLLNGLQHHQATVRLDITRVLGMLDETRALDPLRDRFQVEPDESVRAAIAWAGRRVHDAQQAGYDTLNALYRYFNVDRELAKVRDEAELAMLRQMEQGLDTDLRRQLADASKRRMGMTLAAGLGGAMLAGPLGGLAAARMTMGAGPLDASTGFDPRPHIGAQRTPATRPTRDDITVWVKRLRESLAPAMREQAALELEHLNNPAALPYLAAAFALDPADKVRDAAQRAGRFSIGARCTGRWSKTARWRRRLSGGRRRCAMRSQRSKPRSVGSAPATMRSLPSLRRIRRRM